MKKALVLIVLSALSSSLSAAEPLKALLVAGGCCHDYAKQHEVISKGIQSRANVQVDVVWTDDKSVTPPLPLYDNPDWAKGYDIIIHDECAAGVKDLAVVKRILDVHKTIPAVHLHCAMHSFRTGTDAWFKHLGLQSASHGPQEPIAITFVDKEHPITKPLADWTTIKEELYNNVNLFDAHPLAMGRQVVKGREVDAVVAWTNEKQGARSFSTTIGHNTETVADERYLDLLTRGVLWACDKLNADNLVPFKGENKVTFVAAKVVEAPKPPPAPKDGLQVKATASSEEKGKNNFAWKAVDGDESTRWCAANASYPQWLQLELEKPQTLTGIQTIWENGGVYQFKVEGSTDGKAWTTLADGSSNTKSAPYSNDFAKVDGIRFVKIHALGKAGGGWASIREVKLKGPGIKALAAKPSAMSDSSDKSDPFAKDGNVVPKIVKLTSEQEAAILKDVKVAEGFEATLFANSAAVNYPVFVAAEPDGTLYVSSDGNGSLGRDPKRGRVIRLRDLDGDGRADETKVFCEVDSPRGLVWDHDRLYLVHPPHLSEFIDADHDGVAEKQNILVQNIAFGFKDRPADHTTNGLSLGIDGWLYIAGGDFGFLKATGTDGRTLQHRGGGVIRVRPDGSGLEIYSTGTRNILEVAISPLMDIFARDNTNDGGGWNVRFHHFTGLDDHGYPRLYKNFNDECIQPLADYGGGSGCGAVYIDEPGFGEWNNAPFTCDWGTGALWHHQVKPKGATFEETRAPEPFIKMTRPTDADVDGMSRVYCASWKGATFKWEGPDVGYIVQVKPKGFKPEPLPDFAKAKDEELVKVLESASHRRRMEAQREGLRRIEQSKLAFTAAGRGNSVAEFERVIEKQEAEKKIFDQDVGKRAFDDHFSLGSRTAALYLLVHKGVFPPSVEAGPFAAYQGAKDMAPAIIRAFAIAPLPKFQSAVAHRAKKDEKEVFALLEFTDLTEWPEAIDGNLMSRRSAACQIGSGQILPKNIRSVLVRSMADPDEIIAHMVIHAVSHASANYSGRTVWVIANDVSYEKGVLDFVTPCLGIIDDWATARLAASRALLALAMMHQPEVVTGLIERLGKASDPALRQGILAALCRLHFKEGEWKGDSWGTRPDTLGPYYQPEAWSETPRIAEALKVALNKASGEEAAFLIKEMTRNRIQSNDALELILALAKQDPKVIPDAVAQLATAETIPADAVPILVGALKEADKSVRSPATLAGAIIALAKTDSAEGCAATLTGLAALGDIIATHQVQLAEAGKIEDPNAAKQAKKDASTLLGEANKLQQDAITAFLQSPKLENHHQFLEKEVEKIGSPSALWAEVALLKLSDAKSGSPEAREMAGKSLEAGWALPARRAQILRAVAAIKHQPYADKVLAAADDADSAVQAAANEALKAMKLKKIKDKTPKIATLKPEEALAAVLKQKGDIGLGEQVFTRATCVACHTVKESEAQKGPYLGNIAQTYKRPDLAQNILDPNKTIAQGFASELITMKDGTQQMGFITLEGATEVKLRNIAAQEFTFKVSDIKDRQKLPISMMPPGLMTNFTVLEFASLLDYLESLVKK